ncbi:MAG: DUF3052 family protein [Hamadaea sp.]|nr:DUF3052 family protein [Hamadaea sp.]
MTAGYSGTPLPRKLGIHPGHHLTVLGRPDDVTLGDLPPDTTLHDTLTTTPPPDIVIAFLTSAADLHDTLQQVRPAMAPTTALWICWPKKSAVAAGHAAPTDLTENVIRDHALPTGLVDTKVCAVDTTWSGLRLVIRRALR